MLEHNIWAEKYRPTTLKDCILPERLSTMFRQFAKDKNAPHMLFTGSAGLGKTSTAISLANDIGAEYIKINGSKERNIDTIRNTVSDFVSTVSMDGLKKYVVYDEIDGMNGESAQMALRGFIEDYSLTASFVGTCNYELKLIEGLLSRLTPVDFTIKSSEKADICKGYHTRLNGILKQEAVQYTNDITAKLIIQRFPDFRSIVSICQLYAAQNNNVIDVGILQTNGNEEITKLLDLLMSKDYKGVRMWVAENPSVNYSTIYKNLYDHAYKYFVASSVPAVVLIISKYLNMHPISVDQEITLMGALTEIMMEAVWVH